MHAPPDISRKVTLARAWWLLCGLSAELTAGGYALAGQPDHALAFHVISALALGAWAADGAVMSRPGPFAVACVFVFTVPVLGALGVCAVVVPAWRARRAAVDDGVLELDLPGASIGTGLALDEQGTRVAPAPIEVTLRSDGAAQKRVASVMALRRMDALRAVPLLRVALCDPHEDVRLLAYAILERREKELRARIDRLSSDLDDLTADNAADATQRAPVLKSLAEQNWELAHGGFVSGEVEAHTLQAAVRYGDESLRIAPDGSLALLLARICLRRHNARLGLRYLRAANVLGVATTVLAPHYAEVAYLLRRFDAIGPLLAQAGRAPSARPRLDAVVQFWTERETAS